MKKLFLAWQDSDSRSWFPVGKLIYQEGLYYFTYTQGALEAQQKANFQPLWSFPDFNHCYSSSQLFPLFANRLIRPSRPEFSDFIQWLNIPQDQNDPIALLARSGGKRKTDSFEVFPEPEQDEEGNHHIHFFTHGLRYCPTSAQNFVKTLQPDTRLFLTHDLQNPVDSRALILRTSELHPVGFCPRYLTQDFFELVSRFPEKVVVTVERVNLPPTPLQFRLLCNLSATGLDDFMPFSNATYQPIPCDPLPVAV